MTHDPFAPRFDIVVSGTTLAADVTGRVTGLTVETSLDLAGQCSFVLSNADNSILDSALFDIGKDVEVHGRLLICDPGLPETQQRNPVLPRLVPFRFNIAMHFEASNRPDPRVLGGVIASVGDVVDQLRPAHTLPELVVIG